MPQSTAICACIRRRRKAVLDPGRRRGSVLRCLGHVATNGSTDKVVLANELDSERSARGVEHMRGLEHMLREAVHTPAAETTTERTHRHVVDGKPVVSAATALAVQLVHKPVDGGAARTSLGCVRGAKPPDGSQQARVHACAHLMMRPWSCAGVSRSTK